MNDKSSTTGGDDAESTGLQSDPRASESADLTRVIVEGLPPVEPHPHVWRRIDKELGTERKETNRKGMRRYLWMAAAIVLILGVAGTLVMGTSDSWLQGSTEGVAIRDVSDPSTGAVALTLHTNADGSTIAVSAGTLPTLDEGSTYQLWSVVGTEVVSVGVFGPSIDSANIRLEGDPTVLALTIETAGGVAVSSAAPVAVWTATD
jgi:anti-sigma-K factor RskA